MCDIKIGILCCMKLNESHFYKFSIVVLFNNKNCIISKFLQIALIQCKKNSTILKFQGNHEWHYNFSNYKSRFNMPHDNNKNMFFSFDIGPVHFISISTEFYYFLNYGMSQVCIQIRQYAFKFLQQTFYFPFPFD